MTTTQHQVSAVDREEIPVEAVTVRPGRRSLSLKWRIAVLMSALLVAFAALVSAAVIVVLNASLQRSQEAALRVDAQRLKTLYAVPNIGEAEPPRSSGGVLVSVYDTQGRTYPGNIPIIPTDEVLKAGDAEHIWAGRQGDWNLRALISKINFAGTSPAYLVVASRTDYIIDASNDVTKTVIIVSALLVLFGLGAGYWAASFGLRPLVQVAEQARHLDETNLAPLDYSGPRDELGLLTTTLNHLVARLRRAFDSQKVFLAETSHELRTPLTALEGYLHRALREVGPEAKAPLEDALRLSRTMTRLVSDLLQLSRGDVVQEWVPHLVDLGTVASAVAREFEGVSCDCPAQRAELIGDPDRLTQLTRNLVANAVRAAGKPEGVEVSVRRAGDRVELHVRDNGPGIPTDVLPHIFAKFYRGPQGGSGLGLAIAAQIVRVHKGDIHVYSRPGRGAHFWATFPVYEEDDDLPPPAGDDL